MTKSRKVATTAVKLKGMPLDEVSKCENKTSGYNKKS